MAEYLEREDLIKRLEARIKDYGGDCNSNAPIIANTYKAMLYDVKNMKKADVAEVKHGKWIKDRNCYTCSECGFYYFANNSKANYCPNCGAKIDKEEKL